MREVQETEWNQVHSRHDRLFRVHLTSFITLSARLGYDDLPGTTVLGRYRDVLDYRHDPTQLRTGSDFERREIECIDQLEPEIGRTAAKDPEDITLDDEGAAAEPILRIPPLLLLGANDPDCHFHLLCWNEANALVEGFETPYRASRSIANMGYHKPADPFGLVAPLDDLAMRYEDQPDQREAIADEITALLAGFVARAPWGRG